MAKETKQFKSNKEYLQYLKGGKAEELVVPDYKEPKTPNGENGGENGGEPSGEPKEPSTETNGEGTAEPAAEPVAEETNKKKEA